MSNIDNFQDLLDKALLGTKNKYSNMDIGNQLKVAFFRYMQAFNSNGEPPMEIFLSAFTNNDIVYGNNLRDSMRKYIYDHKCDVALRTLDTFYGFVASKMQDYTIAPEERMGYLKYYSSYSRLASKLGCSLSEARNLIYQNPNMLQDLIVGFEVVGNKYFESIDKSRFISRDQSQTIQITEVSERAQQVLTNNAQNGIQNSFGGTLLGGRISLHSDRGYINSPNNPQQDSILGIAKSEDCILNVVADGAGGSINGEKASMAVTEGLKTWFKGVDEAFLRSLSNDELADLVQHRLIDINNYIHDNYRGSYSTVVLALTVGDRTMIANVGDSTAYAYNPNDDSLVELTTLDSLSKGMSYEGARHNPYNNRITRAMGIDSINPNYGMNSNGLVHFHVVDNTRVGRIILSSDGVTDLVSEERFKSYFRRGATASQIVDDAVYRPDLDSQIHKSSDNVSAIVIDLPNRSYGSYSGARR